MAPNGSFSTLGNNYWTIESVQNDLCLDGDLLELDETLTRRDRYRDFLHWHWFFWRCRLLLVLEGGLMTASLTFRF